MMIDSLHAISPPPITGNENAAVIVEPPRSDPLLSAVPDLNPMARDQRARGILFFQAYRAMDDLIRSGSDRFFRGCGSSQQIRRGSRGNPPAQLNQHHDCDK